MGKAALKKGALVRVEWQADNTGEKTENVSVGFVVERDKRQFTLAQTRGLEGPEITIPMEWLVLCERLKNG